MNKQEYGFVRKKEAKLFPWEERIEDWKSVADYRREIGNHPLL